MNSSWIKNLSAFIPRGFPHSVRVSYLSLMLAASLLGCGWGSQRTSPTSVPVPPMPQDPPPGPPADNWQFLLTPSSSQLPLAPEIDAVVSLTSDKFVGTGYNLGAVCFGLNDPIPLSGTIDSSGNTSVTSAAVDGQVLSITGILAPDRSYISQGTYSFKGGCADGQNGSLTGVKFKPIDGIYDGALTEPDASEALSADLKQSSTSYGVGFLEVTGTVTYTGTCSEKYTISASQLFGSFILLGLSAQDGSHAAVDGTVDANGNKIHLGQYEGGCNDFQGEGDLNLQ